MFDEEYDRNCEGCGRPVGRCTCEPLPGQESLLPVDDKPEDAGPGAYDR